MKPQDSQHLIEIQSLDESILKHLKNIEEQEGRIQFLEGQRHKRQEQMELLQSELQSLKQNLSTEESKLHELDKKLTQNESAQSQVTTAKQIESLETESKALNETKEQTETEAFSLMEKIEEAEQKIADDESFLAGSSESLGEIKLEVEENCKEENRHINNYQERIDALLEQCDSDTKNHYLAINKKFRFKRPISVITSMKCGQCKFAIDQHTFSETAKASSPQTCSNCGRFLVTLPHRD
jgi:predicted  nucleic acid-binding Zn-ribbon protein